MAMNTAGADGDNRIAVGGGFQSGQSAFAVGVQHAFHGTHTTVSLSGAFSQGESSVGVGAGMSW
jgi:autotransporter adhesin